MINKFITFFIFITFLLSGTPVLAQSDLINGYSVQHFTDDNGLPQNSINDLLFDDNGCLWLGSQVGLIRFNGYSFKVYYPDDKPAMESNVQFLGKSNKGHIYFQTDDHSLYCYAGNNSHLLSPVNTSLLKKPRLLNDRKQLFDFTHFLQGNRCNPEQATRIPDDSIGKRKLIFRDLYENNRNFYVIDSSHTYLLYGDTLYYYDNNTLLKLSGAPDHPLQYLVLDKKLYILKRDSILSIFEGGRKIGGHGTIGGDLSRERGPWGHIGIRPGTPGGPSRLFSSGDLNHLLVNNKLYRFVHDATGRLSTRLLLDLSFATHVSGVEYNPGLDLLLIATSTEGFYFLRRSKFRTPPFSPVLQQLLSQHLFGPLALHNGQEIVADKFSFNATGAFWPAKDSIPIRQKCLYIDGQDHIWSAIYNLPRQLTMDRKPMKVFPALDGQIVDYMEDGKGSLYCLTDKSLWVREADSFRRVFNTALLSVKGINESFCLVAPHRWWIANVTGLIEYDAETNRARSIPDLNGDHVRSIHPCRDGSILLGTYGQGYYYYRHNRFFRMPLDKNSFLITAHCFLEDRHDMIWIPCNKGLFRIPKADMDAWCDSGSNQLYYYYYGRQDGLRTNEFNGGYNRSGLITPDGFAVILSMKGTVCFNTDSLQADFPTASPDIASIAIDGKAMTRTDTIECPTGYNSLLLEISCPFLGNRNNLYLEYSLKGLNDEWKEVPEDGIVSLSRLGPGNYVFRVRKVNGFGKDNYSYREWNIIVVPQFYRTTWFIVLSGLILLLLLVLLVQLRLTLVEKQQEIRVKAEKLRGTVATLEATVKKLQESERALLETSQLREKLISLVIHDLRSPLRFLTMLSADLHDNQANLSMEEIRERTYWVKKGAHDIYNFSEDFLLWVTSQKNNFSITRRLFPLRPLLQEIYEFFLEQVQQKGNSIFYEADGELSIYSDPHILITIIRNLVDNANKYTDHGRITINASGEDGQIIITVSDTGRGMSPQQIASFLHNDNLDAVRSGSQLGHKFVFDLTRKIHGTVSIDSKEKTGTTVKLSFPKEGDAGDPGGQPDPESAIPGG